MSLALEDARSILRTLIRSIDKRAEFSVTLQEGKQPGVSVSVSLRKRNTTVLVPVDDLESAVEDSMRRSQLRTTLKAAIDRMSFESIPAASTKMLRGAVVEGGFFRVQQGNRGRR